MATGQFFASVFIADGGDPIPSAIVRVTLADGTTRELITNASGNTSMISIEAPEMELSLDETYMGEVFSTCNVQVFALNYRIVSIEGVQIFANQIASLPVDMSPNPVMRGDTESGLISVEIPNETINDRFSENLDPPNGGISLLILDSVVIPEYVTVHLGTPTSNAQNVTVSFKHYIKNVCCSEIYPTWPEQALVANIYCQISLVLNRIFTEWYRSQGYSFDITNSTSYDQYFVYGRNIFDNISKLVDEIFNIYIRKSNFVEPFYAEYCNGTTATCPGLKQWGTVTLANDGYNALGILRYYYGNEVSLYTTSIVKGTPVSYPGSPLSRGSSGDDVRVIQTQLTRIRRNYPLIPNIGTIDGIFDAATETAVRRFQEIFSLTPDGIVGKATWYKISFIYVAVTKLAELGSEGIASPSVPGTQPTVTLRMGARGPSVSLAQYMLNLSAQFYSNVSPIAIYGVFGSATFNSVLAFQTLRGITADGVIGRNTWGQLYEVFYAALNAIDANPAYPGTPLRNGSTGASVATMQRYLNVISDYLTFIPKITIDSRFGPATENAVRIFQQLFGLTIDGIIGPATWNSIVLVYKAFASVS